MDFVGVVAKSGQCIPQKNYSDITVLTSRRRKRAKIPSNKANKERGAVYLVGDPASKVLDGELWEGHLWLDVQWTVAVVIVTLLEERVVCCLTTKQHTVSQWISEQGREWGGLVSRFRFVPTHPPVGSSSGRREFSVSHEALRQ